MARPTVVCKTCNEPEVKQRKDLLYECPCCGELFAGEPKPQPPRMKGNWKPEKPVKGVKR